MSDNEIRRILAKRKKAERTEMIRGFIEGFVGFAAMLGTIAMMTIIGG